MIKVAYSPSTLAWMSSISIAVIGTLMSSTAFAAERSCSSMTVMATTGGAAQAQLEAIAHCQSTRSTPMNTRVSLSQPDDWSMPMQSEPMQPQLTQPDAKTEEIYPAYCPPLPGNLEPGDFGFREALERCKYGS